MPYCPVCKFEYRPDINKCSDCNKWLVDSLENCKTQSSHHSSDQPTSTPPPEYSDELKKLMKSLPGTPSLPSGPIAPGVSRNEDNYQIDPDDAIAQKLDQHQTWIEVAHFPSAQISQVVFDGLESLRIPCVVIPGSRSGAFWGGQNGGTLKIDNVDILLVPEEFVEQADQAATELLGEAYKEFKTPNG